MEHFQVQVCNYKSTPIVQTQTHVTCIPPDTFFILCATTFIPHTSSNWNTRVTGHPILTSQNFQKILGFHTALSNSSNGFIMMRFESICSLCVYIPRMKKLAALAGKVKQSSANDAKLCKNVWKFPREGCLHSSRQYGRLREKESSQKREKKFFAKRRSFNLSSL